MVRAKSGRVLSAFERLRVRVRVLVFAERRAFEEVAWLLAAAILCRRRLAFGDAAESAGRGGGGKRLIRAVRRVRLVNAMLPLFAGARAVEVCALHVLAKLRCKIALTLLPLRVCGRNLTIRRIWVCETARRDATAALVSRRVGEIS